MNMNHLVHNASFMAHAYSLLWKQWLVAIYAGSDLLIAGAYFAIAVAILIFVRRRPNLEMKHFAGFFAAFIFWLGLIQVVALITLWWPIYNVQGFVKLATAVASVTVAIMIFSLIPEALAIPSAEELQSADARLAQEVKAHEKTPIEFTQPHDWLERRTVARTRELSEAKQQFEALVTASAQTVWSTDADGEIREPSPSWCAFTGQTAEQSRGAGWLDAVYAEDREQVAEQWRRCVIGKIPLVTEYRIRRAASGDWRWMHVHAVPLENADGSVRGWVSMNVDISDRKRAEQELIDGKARLASLVESAATSIISIDSHGSIESVNPATEKLFGYDRTELIGRNVSMLMPDPHAGQHDKFLSNYLDTGTKKVIGIAREVSGLRKDGTVLPIQLAVSEFEAKGKRYFTGIINDLSDRKHVEEALRESEWRLAHSQKMEAVGQLTGGVAHDFNNLLTVISANLELHEAVLPAGLDARLLHEAREAVEMGSRLTERLLTFSRRRRLAPAVVNLNEQVLGMAELLRRTLGEAIELSIILVPDLWPIRVDSSEIENVILNLALNARDAMPQGGKIIIETRKTTLDDGSVAHLARGDYVLLSVSDFGIGMSPEVLQHAFEPFFTTKEPGKGTGLGLASIYGFVTQSGGHASIYSEVGRGTTVNIHLPRLVDVENPVRAPANHVSVATTGDERILLVEDNALVRRSTVRRLEALGFKVIEAESGPAAVKVLESREEIVDLVFTDVVMAGGMSGLDLARWIRERRPALKVLLTSGFAEQAASADAELERELTILRKPYGQAELIRTLRESLKA
jgi:PAS domain S-box-containing protein